MQNKDIHDDKATSLSLTDDERLRDHLANERTYLAWLRTGISAMGFGVVITKLKYMIVAEHTPSGLQVDHAATIGLILAIMGLLLIVVAAQQYATVQKRIRDKIYKADNYLPFVISAIVFILGVLIIYFLWQG